MVRYIENADLRVCYRSIGVDDELHKLSEEQWVGRKRLSLEASNRLQVINVVVVVLRLHYHELKKNDLPVQLFVLVVVLTAFSVSDDQ